MIDTPEIKQNANGVWMLEGEQLWDTDLLPIILEHIKEGDTVIDAGAWIGGHTMPYAKKVGGYGKIVAVEPNPHAFECLKRNTEQFPNVDCLNIALGDAGRCVPFSSKRGWYDSGYVGDDQKLTSVQMLPLDSYDIAPNFIKIDVEGCELKVLKGAEKTIEKSRPKMVVEINKSALQRQGSTSNEVLDWLEQHEYTWRIIEDTTLGASIFNILCTPK